MAQIFPTDFEEKLTMAQDDYILFSDSEDGNKIKKAQYKNLKGEKGDPGTPGADGKDGKDGTDGTSATITVGSTTTGAAGSSASVVNSGTSSAAVLDFTIPQGAKGEDGKDGADGKDGVDGAAATISAGTTTTLSPGSSATVTNSGTSSAAVFNFGIPQGATGATGNGIASITSSKSGKITTVTITETNTNVDTFQISDGADGQGSGDVLGPNSSVDGDIVLFDGTSGKLIKDSGVTLGTAASCDTGTSSGNVPVLDSNGKLNKSTLPGVALTDTFTVSTSSDLTSLSSAEQGDLAIATSENKTYVLSADPYSTAANWKEILSPTGGVTSVNSQTGAVTLDADDISDSTTTNKFVTASDKTTWSGKQDALTLPATPTQGHLVTWGANNKTFADGGAIPTIVYATQAEYTALLPGAASDGKHYLIYHDTGGWQPGAHTLLYLPLEGDVDDYSGNGNDGIRTNDGTTEDTTIAQYLTLSSNKVVAKINGTGSSGSHPTIVVPSFNTAPKTISLWVYKSYSGESGYNDTGVSGWKTVAGQLAGDGQNGWEFRVSGSVDGQSNIWYQCGDWSNGRIFPSGGYSYQGQRLHLVATCNNSITSYYINGVLKGSLGKVIQANNDLWIGTAPFEYGNVTNAFFWGCFSEVILEDIEWTATDIANYYNDTKAQYGIS